ncbi:MAG: Zn-ribbon domain-containing OB-fold protein [Dehalococcoidia bacterium]
MTAPPRQVPKPLPVPSRITKPFWDAAKQHRLSIQRCDSCNEYVFYPRPICPHCSSDALAWTDVSGRATLYSFTIARKPTARPWAEDVPYVIAIVELEEGPRMTSNIVGCPVDDVRIGMPLIASFEDVSDEITLVKFRPA